MRMQRSQFGPKRIAGILALVVFGCVMLANGFCRYDSTPEGLKQVRRFWKSLTGTITPNKQVRLVTKIDATPEGTQAIAFQLRELWSGHQLVIANDTLWVSGRFIPVTNGADLPMFMRLEISHLSSSGEPLTTKTLNLWLAWDGAIDQPIHLSDWFLVDYKEYLAFSLTPIYGDLPACNVDLTFSASSRFSTQAEGEADVRKVRSAATPRVVYTYAGYPAGVKKGQVCGHVVIAPLAGSALTMAGKMVVSGKIVPDGAAPLPTKIKAVIKHTDSSGNILATDRFGVHINADGTIPSQSFPFTTINAQGIKEWLNISFVPVDQDLPDNELKVVVSFMSTSGG